MGGKPYGSVQGDQELRSDQLAPHNIEAEEAVLGAVLIHSDALIELMDFLRGDDFFIVRHMWIWEAMLELHERGDPIDYLTVVNELEQMERLAELGGAAYILGLVNKTPSALNAEGYGRIVERMSLRRRMIDAAGQIARVAHSDETDIDEVVNQAEAAILEVSDRRGGRGNSELFQELRTTELGRFLHHLSNPDYIPGLMTYIPSLDNLVGPMPYGEVAGFLARPGGMKTGVLFQITIENAKRGNRMGVFSLEMSKEQFTQRCGANQLLIPTDHLSMPSKMSEDETRRYIQWLGKEETLPLMIDDSGYTTIQDIRSSVRRWVHQYGHWTEAEDGLAGIAVDYLQIVSPGWSVKGADNERIAIGSVIRGLKQIAKEFKISAIVALQANRKADGAADKTIKDMDKIAGAAAIDNECYKIASINRPDPDGKPNEGVIYQIKNRNGPTGGAPVFVRPQYVRFDSPAYNSEDQYGGK